MDLEHWSKPQRGDTYSHARILLKVFLVKKKAYQLLSPLWDKASARFVGGADGVIHAFLNYRGISDTSVFMRIEYEIAKEQGLEIYFSFGEMGNVCILGLLRWGQTQRN
jgi:hypothetical protein